MTDSSLSKFELARQIISTMAQKEGIEVDFSKGKRKNDILVMNLSTQKSNALIFYLKVSKELPKYLIQIFRLPDPDRRGLTAALIEPEAEPLKETDPFFKERRSNFYANESNADNWEEFLQKKE